MSETKNALPRVGRWYRVGGTVMQCGGTDVSDVPARHVFLADDGADVKIAVSEWPSADAVSLGTTGQRFAALEARIAALEARLLAPPAVAWTPSPESVAVFPGGFVRAHDVSDEVRASLRACHVDHDTCSAEQRSGTGRAAQGTCVRGVVDLVAASADDQHAAERGTPAAGAEVTASEGGDTARDDSVVAEAVEMRAELERERVRRKAADDALSKSVSGERRKWAVAIASAIVGADLSGCESFVSREEMAASVAAMRTELALERKLRRESEEAFKAESMRRDLAGANLGRELALKREQEVTAERDAQRHELAEMRAELERERVRRRAAEDALSKAARDPRSEEARKRGLTTGARVRFVNRPFKATGTITGWDLEGDPCIDDEGAYSACQVELDTEATT